MTPGERGGSFLALLERATGPGDRWVMGVTALMVLFWLVGQDRKVGAEVWVHRDNRLLMTLDLAVPRTLEVVGRLGPVRIQVEEGRVRLLEYDSLRLIGTRTGWIQRQGEIAACVPCGIVLQIGDGGPDSTGNPDAPDPDALDGIAR